MNCLGVFDHFVELKLKGFNMRRLNIISEEATFYSTHTVNKSWHQLCVFQKMLIKGVVMQVSDRGCDF